MKIFPYMNNITYSLDKQFLAEIKKSRKQLGKEDKELIGQKAEDFSFSNDSDVPEGRLRVCENGVCFECFYHGKQSDELWVILSGSKMKGDKLPLFKRWSWYSFIDASTLSVADPMLQLDENTFLGWYYGTEEHCYMDDLVEVVRKIALIKGIDAGKIVFYGSSGGGYAALYCACELEGSTAIAINPQIKLSFHKNSRYFKEHLKIDLDKEDRFLRTDLGKKIVLADRSKFILIENCQSEEDMQQLAYVCSYTGTSFKYGLSQLMDHIICWCYEADGIIPHNCQEDRTIFFSIQYLYHFWKRENRDIRQIESLYLLFGEFWQDKFIQKKRLDELRRKVIDLPYEILAENEQQLFADKIHFDSKEGSWSNRLIYGDFLPDSTYALTLSGLKSDEQKVITVLMKDTLTNSVVWKKECNIGERQRFDYFFRTFQDAKKMELRIYPTRLGEKSNAEVDISRVCLYRLLDQ